MIPKHVYMTYRTTEIPKRYIENVAHWQHFMPDWEFRYTSDQGTYSFFKSYFPEYFPDLPKVTSGAVLADLFRYGVLYIHGGMYTDMDTFPFFAVPDEWLTFDAVLGYEYQPSKYILPFKEESNHDILCQWTFLSQPKHPLFKAALDLSMDRLREKNFTLASIQDHLNTAGPHAFTDAAAPFLSDPNILVHDMEVFGAHPRLLPRTENSLLEHQFDGRYGWQTAVSAPQIKFL